MKEKRGQIVALANQKGGVGKTTLAVHLAAWLARRPRRVVLVDCDPQGNATSWLTDGDLSNAGLFRLLVVDEPLGNVVRPMNGRWGVGLLPGNSRTGEAFVFLASTGKPFDTVARLIRPLATVADYVLVDMPPSKAAGFHETLFAADWVVVPTQLERLSLEGVNFMAQTCQALAREQARGPRLLGVVPNMVRARTREHREQLRSLVRVFGGAVWPPVPLCTRVPEACAYGRVMFDFAPRETATESLSLVGRRLLVNLEGEE